MRPCEDNTPPRQTGVFPAATSLRVLSSRAAFSKTTALALRIGLTIVGGYALSVGLAGCLTLALIFLGMAASEATLLLSITAFIVYLAVLIWGFQESRIPRLLLWLVVCPLGLIATAEFLRRFIPVA